jgi:hypothetical protein
MTFIGLEDSGLPCAPVTPWMVALEAEGWQGGGLIEPTPRYVALWYDDSKRCFALIVDIVPSPVSYRIIPGTAAELLAWVETERPEYVGDEACDAWRHLNEYANDPESEERWWQICEDVDAGRIDLSLNVGDA